MLTAISTTATVPIVRVPWNDMVTIKRVLDAGAQSLLVPYVCSADEAKAAVAAMRYPPAGVRGVAGTTRASRFGRVKDYARRAQEEICLLVQVETMAGINALDDILAVEGLDGAFIGPADLAADMGHPGDSSHPEVQKTIKAALAKIAASSKAAGILSTDDKVGEDYRDWGAQFLAVGIDVVLFAKAVRAKAAHWKG